jgi:hypothetical protein
LGALLSILLFPKGGVFLRHTAEPNSKDHSTVAEKVQRRNGIGQHKRPPSWQGRDRRANFDVSGGLGDSGQDYPGVTRWNSPGKGQMIPHENPLPAGGFCRLRQLNDRARVGVITQRRIVNALVHAQHLVKNA